MTEPERRPPSRGPLIVGFLLAGGVLLGLAMFSNSRRGGEPDTVPGLTVLQPRGGDTLSTPLVIRFRTAANLSLGRDGWTADGLHPHVLLDGAEIMAGAADIAREGQDYTWRLPAVGPGDYTLYLTWAGGHHGLASDTTGQAVTFHLR